MRRPTSVPRLLFLTGHSPAPATSGGRRRELELLRRVSIVMDVEVCAVTKTFEGDLRHVNDLRAMGIAVRLFPTERLSGEEAHGLSILERRHHNGDARRWLQDVLRDPPFDVVHVEGFYLRRLLPETADTPIVMGTQNIEYQLDLQRLVVGTGSSCDRRSIDLARQREIAAWASSDLVLAVTEDDARVVGDELSDEAVRIVPDGYDHSSSFGAADVVLWPPLRSPNVVFVGNLGYQPNVDAVLEFASAVLPRIRGSIPEVQFVIVGDAPPPEVLGLEGPGVRVVGRVPEVEAYLRACDVFVCPLRIGGGVKVKILEALREGCNIVTTAVGLQGLDQARPLVRVAEDAASFADSVVEALAEGRAPSRLGETPLSKCGWPTWDDATSALLNAYSTVVPNLQDRLRLPA